MNIRRDQRIQEGWLANAFFINGRVSTHDNISFLLCVHCGLRPQCTHKLAKSI